MLSHIMTAVVVAGMYDCGRCRAVKGKKACEDVCGVEEPREVVSGVIDLRVTKGFGSKGYPGVRLSVITQNGNEPAGFNASGFDYSAGFKYKWTGNSIHTSIVAHPTPGTPATFNIGGTPVTIPLPAPGASTAGLLIGDPCYISATFKPSIQCNFGNYFGTGDRAAHA
eukprot:TRINITY_DN28957_c0_g1_i1.p4 TRINITY_DN28957_c0_g1~~TRINITY_DN28957_c0_g1_i1.p4  ORF type:complete len:168 (+),score=50.48 TRINITY_DN28957_c0_g1_i1:1161-1664(+)